MKNKKIELPLNKTFRLKLILKRAFELAWDIAIRKMTIEEANEEVWMKIAGSVEEILETEIEQSNKKLFDEIIELKKDKRDLESHLESLRADQAKKVQNELVPLDKLTPKILHDFYLDAICNVDSINFNPKANKEYNKLNPQQQSIDQYICKRIKETFGQPKSVGVIKDEKTRFRVSILDDQNIWVKFKKWYHISCDENYLYVNGKRCGD